MNGAHWTDELDRWLDGVAQLADDPMFEHVSRFARAGKRLRPRLAVELFRLRAGEPTAALVRDLAALELLHVSTLIHDDIIDGSEQRRDLQTVNGAFGAEAALLAGNLVRAHALLVASPAARPWLDRAGAEVDLGQLRETRARTRECVPVQEVLAIEVFKAGRMFRCAVRLASLHVNHPFPEEVEDALEAIAIAYQAHDDLMDLGPADTKSVGLDAQNNVHSFVRGVWGAVPALPPGLDPAAERVLGFVLGALPTIEGAPLPGQRLVDLDRARAERVTRGFCNAVSRRALEQVASLPGLERVVSDVVDGLLGRTEVHVGLAAH